MTATRRVLLSLLLVIGWGSIATAQSPLRWETNLDQALKTAAASNKLVLVHFWAPWCKPCQKLEGTVFKQPNVGRQLESQYVLVKLDLDHNHAYATKWKVEAIPTDVILSPQGDVVFKTTSPQSAEAYVSTMQQIAANHRGPAATVAAKPVSVVPNVGATKPSVSAAVTAPPIQSPPAGAQLPVAAQPAPAQQPIQAQQPAPTTSAIASSPSGDGRYDYYYNRSQPQAAAAPVQSAPVTPSITPSSQPAAVSQAPVTVQPPIASQPPVAAQPPISAPIDQRYALQPSAPPQPQSPAIAAPTGPVAQDQLPPGSPVLALDGFCPVTLVERKQWAQGDVRWGAVHRGRTYLFANQADQQKFLAQPDRYSPVLSGNDPVLALNGNQTIAGRREHGVFYGERVFLFASEDTLAEFTNNPTRYSAEVTSARKP